MDSLLAVPFIVGGSSQVAVLFVQRLVDATFARDFRSALDDGSANQYNPPPTFDEIPIRRRITRDTDALSAVTYAASTLSTAISLLPKDSLAFGISLGIGSLLPVGALAVLLTIEPGKYYRASLLRDSFQITPFVYVAVVASIFLAVLMPFTGSG